MIFRLPYSWLKEYVDVPKNPHDLARQISLYGPSVERVGIARHEFTKVVVGEIMSIERHPDADKLRLATVRAGGSASYKIVCGAPNIKVGQKVPLALIGATLPGGVAITRREVRGVVSEGMLCSARELGVHDDQLGILILHPASKVGSTLTDLGAVHDHILEVEPTTNRPDLSSVIGVAREVSAITGKLLKPKALKSATKKTYSCPVKVRVLNRKLCPRFMVVLIRGVAIGASPWWMQERLERAGIRPINAAVDITNYVLLEYGQPLHVFDADKLGMEIIVREARHGEKLLALDGRVYNLRPGQLVVADAKKPVSIAGVMGGEETAVTASSVNVVLECANFNPVSIRRTSRDLQLFSESSHLFEKGLSEESPTFAMARAVEFIQNLCGGTPSSIVDLRRKSYRSRMINFPLSHVHRVLGVTIPRPTVARLLKKLGFGVSGDGQILKVTVPYWRDHDVSEPEDLVEEVARLYGYHHFPSVLPPAILTIKDEEDEFAAENKMRRCLTTMGFTEVLSHSFIRESWMAAMGYSIEHALKLSNPLTHELVFMRPSLLPSLCAVLEFNLARDSWIKIFEIAKIYEPGNAKMAGVDRYRHETVCLAGIISGSNLAPETLFREIRGYIESLCGELIKEGNTGTEKPKYPFAKGLAVSIAGDDKETSGTFGILDSTFLRALGINQLIGAFEIPLSTISILQGEPAFRPFPKFPAVKRDISLAISSDIRYNELVKAMKSSTPLLESVELFDIYDNVKGEQGHRSYAMHLIYRALDRTLSSAEVEKVERAMLTILQNKFKIAVR